MTKRRITRALAALLAALTLLSLAACGDVTVVDVDTDSSTTVQQTDEQKKNNTAKSGNKTDGKTGSKTDDTKKDNAKKDDASKVEDTKKDDAKQEEIKQEEAKQDEPKQEIDPATGKDKYQTDPVPEGKPTPVEPQDTTVDTSKTYSCTFSISCATLLNNMDTLEACAPEKVSLVPSDGTILSTTTVTFTEGESVFDVLQRICRDNGIHMESSWTPMYNSAYVEGINNLYEFDGGKLSGWMYKVNGWFPNYGCSRYQLQDGDTVCWVYTCDLGKDVGGYMGG